MSADKTPLDEAVEQALDAFLYAPIGLLFDGPARFPKLVRNGRSQVTNARMMGMFAVQMGRTEVTKRATELDGPVLDLLRGLGLVPGATPTPTPAPTPTEAADAAPATTPAEPAPAEASAEKTAAKKTPAKARAAKKGPAKKAATRKATARKAAEAAPVQAPTELAIPDYDSLSASQVVTRLRGLSDAELEAVRAYEAATRGRKTILNKVQQLRKA
ncbi:MAG TPA: hypothetical protein VFU14_05130 [Acidimicrobiales bacterium]|nr:hypothetical protein [Acidimicrobiales bacterium]